VVDAVLECSLDGLDRVLGSEARRSTVSNPEERPVAAQESQRLLVDSIVSTGHFRRIPS
jgi:hypothetical protein